MERASDIIVAIYLAGHIDNPCEDQYGNDLREVYLRIAREAIQDFENPFAKEFLLEKIRTYSVDNL